MGMTTKQILQGVHDWTDDNFGRKDGFYEQLVSGGALALIGQTQRTNDAMYRKSGDPEQVITGDAIVTKIQGQTKAWNQLVDDVHDLITSKGLYNVEDARFSIVGTVSASSVQFVRPLNTIVGHKCLLYMNQYNNNSSVKIGIYANGYVTQNLVSPIIVTASAEILQIALMWGTVGENIDISFNLPIFDLTLIYGEGNEPTTVEQFEADYFKWFGKPLTYEEYDAGSLRSVQLESLKTTGFNQWDEDVFRGTFDVTNGETKMPQPPFLASNNKIGVFPNTEYFLKSPGILRIFYYGANKEYLTSIAPILGNSVLTIPNNVYYIRFQLGYTGSYQNDICINISNPAKNGTYEPYEEHVAPIPVTTLKGKLNGEGESVTIFPDGMKSAGTIADEIYTVADKTYAVVRVGSVDLGRTAFSKGGASTSAYDLFVTGNVLNRKSTSNQSLCSRLLFGGLIQTQANALQYGDGKYCFYSTNAATGAFVAVQTAGRYNSASEFQTAMNGVMLYYELETPLVYEVEGFTLPKTYLVDCGGTEEQVQKANVQGIAAILTCIYGVDAVGILDKLPRNYISEASMDNFLAKLNIATNGVWTKSFNESSGEWDFNYTPNAQTNANTNEESI